MATYEALKIRYEKLRAEGYNSFIEKLLKDGKTPEQISEFCEIEIDEVRAVQEKMLATT